MTLLNGRSGSLLRKQAPPSTAAASFIATLLVAALIGQEAALAYGHFMYRAAESIPDVTWRGLSLLIPPLAAVAFVFFKHPWTPMPCGLGPLSLLFFTSTLASVWMAASNCLNTKYFFGDSLRFIAPWLTLILSCQSFTLIRRRQGAAGLLRWYHALAAVALLDALITAGFGLKYYGYHISNWFYIFLIGWVVLRQRSVGTSGNLVLGLVLLATVASGKRTNFALVAFALVAAMALLVQRGGKMSRLCVTVAVMLTAGASAQLLFAQYSRGEGLIEVCQRVFEKMNEIVIEGNHDRSYELRVNETRNVTAHFEKHPYDIVLGVGFGGEVPLIYNTGTQTPSGNMHHVHKGYWLYLLRNGLLGVVLLAGFVWTSTGALLMANSSARLITASCALYSATRIIAAFGGNLMMEDLDLPLVTGLGLAFVDLKSSPGASGQTVVPALRGKDCHGIRGSHGRDRQPLPGKASVAPRVRGLAVHR